MSKRRRKLPDRPEHLLLPERNAIDALLSDLTVQHELEDRIIPLFPHWEAEDVRDAIQDNIIEFTFKALNGKIFRLWGFTIAALHDRVIRRATIVYIRRMVVNDIEKLRRSTSMLQPMGELPLVDSKSSEPNLEFEEFVEFCRSRLSTDDMKIVNLLYEGYQQKEIANILSCHLNTVWNRINRVRRQLEGHLDDFFDSVVNV